MSPCLVPVDWRSLCRPGLGRSEVESRLQTCTSALGEPPENQGERGFQGLGHRSSRAQMGCSVGTVVAAAEKGG